MKMMKCDYCELARGKIKAEVVYEDEQVIAIVKERAAFPGQISILPKEHYTIVEMVPDSLINHIFRMANKVSVAIFESLGVQGTNIIVQNGTGAGQKVPHFAVEVIPRKEGDGLNFQWQTKQLLEEEMDVAYLQLKEEGEQIVVGQEEEKKTVSDGKMEMKLEKVKEKEGEENYLLKSLKRVP